MKTTNRKKNMRLLYARENHMLTKFVCPHCAAILQVGEGHFVPPSMGDKGFFTCSPSNHFIVQP